MKQQRGQTLVATMVVLVVICILAGVYLVGSGKSSRKDGKGATTVGAALMTAHDTECRSNIRQVRQAIQMRWTTDDEYPPSLQDTRLGDRFYACPIGKEPYEYDPSTGKVKCVHPGHEEY